MQQFKTYYYHYIMKDNYRIKLIDQGSKPFCMCTKPKKDARC